MNRTYLLYDRGRLEFQVPDSWQMLEPSDPPAICNLPAVIDHALADPIGTRPLLELAQVADKAAPAVIVISDMTRPVPNREFLPQIIDVLRRGGYGDDQIIILIATGMHRPSTEAERIDLVGERIARKYEIIDHRADAPDTLVELPEKTTSGTKVAIDATYYNAKFRVVTGFIEPHFMAGFSGGRKSICPGLVNLSTIQKFHGPEFLGDPRAATGVLEGNPCHREAVEVARMVPPDFTFNVTIDAAGKITGLFAGDLERAHAQGVQFVRRSMSVQVDTPFDLVVTSGGGYPLDTTFYQTVKGMVAASDLLENGGKVVVAAGCAEGIGSPEYKNLMFQYSDDYKTFLKDIFARDEVLKDQWEFQMQIRVLEKTGWDGLIMLTDGIPIDDLRKCSVVPAEDLVGPGRPAELMENLIELLAPEATRAAVLPRGPYILPKVTQT